MRKKTMFIWAIVQGVCIFGSATNEQSVFLQRIVNPKQGILSGGTHNSVHFSCITPKGPGSAHGLLPSNSEESGLGFSIPTDCKSMAILLTIGKNHFSLYRKSDDIKHLILRQYQKGTLQLQKDHIITVDGFKKGDAHYVSLNIEHKANCSAKEIKVAISAVKSHSAISLQTTSAFPTMLNLQRIENPDQSIFGGGTHNLVHYSCVTPSGFGSCHGFISAGEESPINFSIPIGSSNVAILLSVAKKRFNIFQKSKQAQSLVFREYEKGAFEVREDREVSIENMPKNFDKAFPIVLQVLHGADFLCRLAKTLIGKRSQSTSSVPLKMYTPLENMSQQSYSFNSCPTSANSLVCSNQKPPAFNPDYKQN